MRIVVLGGLGLGLALIASCVAVLPLTAGAQAAEEQATTDPALMTMAVDALIVGDPAGAHLELTGTGILLHGPNGMPSVRVAIGPEGEPVVETVNTPHTQLLARTLLAPFLMGSVQGTGKDIRR